MDDGDRVRIDVLGPVRTVDPEGRDVTPEGTLQRRLLALLVLRRGHVVSVDTAIDVLWPRSHASGAGESGVRSAGRTLRP